MTVGVTLNLKKCSLWDAGGVGTHLQTQPLQTNWNDRFSISLPLIYLLGHLAASRFRRRSDEQGSKVRGRRVQGARWEGGRGVGGVHTVCRYTYEVFVPTGGQRLPFPSASVALDYLAGPRGRKCSSLRGFEKWGAERKGGHSVDLGMQSSHTWACRGRWVCMLKMNPPSPHAALRGHWGLEPNHNKHRDTQTLNREREDSHIDIQSCCFFWNFIFKIIFSLFHFVVFPGVISVAMPLEFAAVHFYTSRDLTLRSPLLRSIFHLT